VLVLIINSAGFGEELYCPILVYPLITIIMVIMSGLTSILWALIKSQGMLPGMFVILLLLIPELSLALKSTFFSPAE
jgi:hypothetical protein